ncbi:MAG: hypothetical protein Q8N83_11995 [Ignavibacteria bacterium]|nr:hypothetical protein [Ignavibacteria bacterium]
MAKLNTEFKEAISALDKNELEKIVLRFSKKNKEMYDTLCFEYVKNESAMSLFEDSKEQIEIHFYKLRNGVVQRQLANAISKSVKTINNFRNITKDLKLEADLLLYLLKLVFDNYQDELGTCWTIFDSKLAITTNRFINFTKNNLHEDYWIEYREESNNFIKILKNKSRHIDFVYNMPNSF